MNLNNSSQSESIYITKEDKGICILGIWKPFNQTLHHDFKLIIPKIKIMYDILKLSFFQNFKYQFNFI